MVVEYILFHASRHRLNNLKAPSTNINNSVVETKNEHQDHYAAIEHLSFVHLDDSIEEGQAALAPTPSNLLIQTHYDDDNDDDHAYVLQPERFFCRRGGKDDSSAQEEISITKPTAEQFDKVFSNVMMKYQFPMTIAASDLSREEAREFKSKGEHQFLQSRIRALDGCSTLFLCRIPRTLYELCYIREYLDQRRFTAFAEEINVNEAHFGNNNNGNNEDDDCEVPPFFTACKPFLYDYKTQLEPVSEEAFFKRIREYQSDKAFQHLHFELNNKILDLLLATVGSSKTNDDNNNSNSNGDDHHRNHRHDDNDDVGAIYSALIEKLSCSVIRDLMLVQQQQQQQQESDSAAFSQIAYDYSIWPLTHPTIVYELESIVEATQAPKSSNNNPDGVIDDDDDERFNQLYEQLAQVYTERFKRDYDTLLHLLRPTPTNALQQQQQQQQPWVPYKGAPSLASSSSSLSATELIATMRRNGDGCPLYRTLLKCFIPTMLLQQANNNNNNHNDNNNVSYADLMELSTTIVDPLSVADTCVHCFTRTGYLDEALLWSIIQTEYQHSTIFSNNADDVFFLYRGTCDRDLDSPFRKTSNNPSEAHTLSYGMGLFSAILHDETANPYNKVIEVLHHHRNNNNKDTNNNNNNSNQRSKANTVGYLVKLKKHHFLPQLLDCDYGEEQEERQAARNLFYIPPLSTIAHIASIGEIFHPRSKVFIRELSQQPLAEAEVIGVATEGDPLLLRQRFVSGVYKCSYHALPRFLLTSDLGALRLFQQCIRKCSLLLGVDGDDGHVHIIVVNND